MAQPVRKIIKETHPELIKEEEVRTLLIDGNSLLFLSFADKTLNSDGLHVGGIYQFFLQVRMMLSKYNPDYVYCFFDNEYSGLLRWKIYPQYKANRDKHYDTYGQTEYWKQYNESLNNMQNYIFSKNKPKTTLSNTDKWNKLVDENFDRERDRILMYCEELFIRTYIDDVVEGDDLISYYCKNKLKNEKVIIMSGDMDLTQLIAEDIAVYNLTKKKFISIKNFKEEFGYDYHNVALRKILCGDTSDNIGNIKGLSEDGLEKLMPEIKTKYITLEEVKKKANQLNEERVKGKKKPLKLYENIINGISNKEYNGDFYEINDKLINLKNPIMSQEAIDVMDSMIHVPIDPEGRTFENLYQYILEDGIVELTGDTKFATFFNPFKKLIEKEKNKYLKSLGK